MTLDDITAYGDAAVVAIAAGEWATAEQNLMAAATGYTMIPDIKKAASEVKYDRQWFTDRLNEVRRKLGQANAVRRGGIQLTKVRAARVSE